MSTALNGHRVPNPLDTEHLQDVDVPVDIADGLSAAKGEDSLLRLSHRALGVRKSADPVARLAEEVHRARGLVALQDDEALQLALSARERAADRKVTERLRAFDRAERRRSGAEQAREARRARADARWTARAQRGRQRLLNPNRRLASTYRRYVILSVFPIAVIIGGVAWMSASVHHGVVGVHGTWLGYLIEPMASVLLIVSMIAQFTAIENREDCPRWFLWLDVGIAAASLFLNIVPWGVRFGWQSAELPGHVFPPLLVVAGVAVFHMINRLFGNILVNLHDELTETRLNEQTADVVVLYERAKREIAAGRLAVGESGKPSREGIRRLFNIGKGRAQLTGDAFDVVHNTLGPAAESSVPARG
jgi:hypothetical protein